VARNFDEFFNLVKNRGVNMRITTSLRSTICAIVLAVSALSELFADNSNSIDIEGETMMKLISIDFDHDAMIPKKFTCQGKDVNPQIKFLDVPADAETLALIVDDPDAPGGTWIHWVLFDIPLSGSGVEIKEDSAPGTEGTNSWGRIGYGGPCPPSGTHRYFFKGYALDGKLELKKGATKDQLLKAMDGHVLAKAELIGLYKKN